MASSQPKIVRPIEGSVTRSRIICLFDNVERIIMNRHVKKKYGMSWDEYKAFCGLPDDYPYASPAYLDERRGFKHESPDYHLSYAAPNARKRVIDTPAFKEEKLRFLDDLPTTSRIAPSYPPCSGPPIVRPIKGSVTREKIYCLFDNEPRVLMASYVLRHYGMTWNRYLEYCGLPQDYPKASEAYMETKARGTGRRLKPSVQMGRRQLHSKGYLEEKRRIALEITRGR